MYVASTSHVWRLIPVSIPMQIQQLLHDKQFSLALMLAVSYRCFPSYKLQYIITQSYSESLVEALSNPNG